MFAGIVISSPSPLVVEEGGPPAHLSLTSTVPVLCSPQVPLPNLHSTCTLLTPGTYLSLILCSPRYVYVPLIQCSLQVPLHVTMLTYVRYLNLLILLAQEPDLTQYYPVLSIAHLSFLVLSCYILFFLSSAQCSSVPFSCPILSFRVFSCPILSYPVRSCLIVSYPVLPSPFRSILS